MEPSSGVVAEADALAYARVLVEIGELFDAEATVARVLDDHPEDRSALDLFAKVKHMRGGLSEAVACWAQLHARSSQNGSALTRLGAMLQLAKDPERGAGEFLAVGPFQLLRKPAAHLELEEAFRQFVARRPDHARSACQRLAAKHRGQDREVYKLAVLAEAWIAELSGERAAAVRVLEELGNERGFETDVDRITALARLYEQLGGREPLEKATHIYRFLEGHTDDVWVLGALAALCRKLGETSEAAEYDRRYLEAFRRCMHRPSFAEVVTAAARQYVPLEKLLALRFAEPEPPPHPTPREEGLMLALAGDFAHARARLHAGGESLDLKYLANLAALQGNVGEAARLYVESLDPELTDVRVVGWLLDHAGEEEAVAEVFRRAGVGERVQKRLEALLRAAPVRGGVWRQLAALHRILGRSEEAARCLERSASLEEARQRGDHPVGRVLAAAVYHFVGTAKGLIHEVWTGRKPAAPGRGGFLEEILGNLTPEMKEATRNTFLSVREFARARFPHRTEDILDYGYTYKVTKEDEPSGGLSAGLPSALAFLSVFIDCPVPQDVASSGVLIADAHDVLVLGAVGESEYKVRGAYNRNLRQLILPQANRRDLLGSALVPGVICQEIVAHASTLDEAVTLTFGEDIWIR
jgi:tetratricopeptide (TPR) repeat protein